MQPLALVTGATGFVGSHLIERLHSQGWRVRALVRESSDTRVLERMGVELVRGDLDAPEVLLNGGPGADALFHLAAVTGLRGDQRFVRANEIGTERLVDAVRKADARPRRFVYLSSYAACGPADGRPRRADETPRPLTAYGRTKLAGERAAASLNGTGVEVVVLRAPTVYGPGDRALLPYFRLVKLGLAPAPGGPERMLHVVFAPDLARALVRAAHGPVGTLAVAEPVEHTWGGLADAIGQAVGRRPIRVPLPPPLVRIAAATSETIGRLAGRAAPLTREKAEEMLAKAWVCDLTGSESLLAKEDATPLADGMAQTVEWYRRQGWL